MSAESIVSQLDASLRVLRNQWSSAKALWNDSVSQHFEAHYFNSIYQQTNNTLPEMYELARILSEARRRVR